MAEFNLIQKPELIRRLQTMLGIRQQHITPGLNEGVQAVVILGDVRQEVTNIVPVFTAAAHVSADGTPGSNAAALLWNPGGINQPASQTLVKLRHVWWMVAGQGGNPQIKISTRINAAFNGFNTVDGPYRGASTRTGIKTGHGEIRGGLSAGETDQQFTYFLPPAAQGIDRSDQVVFWDFQDDDWVLPPGYGSIISYDSADACAGYVTMMWEEYPEQ